MSEVRRRVLSEVGKERWAAMTPERREGRLKRSYEAYAAKYPERVELSNRTRAAIADGSLVPGPCADCGGDGAQPEYDYTRLELARWSHYDCRKKRVR